MMTTLNSYSERQLKQAIAWFVRLQAEQCPPEDQQLFDAWLAQKPAHRAAYQAAEQVWGKLDNLKALDIPGLQEARSAQGSSLAKRTMKAYVWLLSLVLAGTAWLELDAETVYYATAAHERRHIELADHSQVDLNANTRLSVRLSPFRRRLVLEQGEALFAVAPAPLRSFVVDVGRLRIRDIGTRFNVQAEPKGATIAVLEGEVELNDGLWLRSHSVPAGKRVHYSDKHGVDPMVNAEADSDTAWLKGHLVFKKTPLKEVTAQLQRYHAIEFVFADPALAEQTLSGTFDSDDIKPFLKALEVMLPVKVKHEGDRVVVSAAR